MPDILSGFANDVSNQRYPFNAKRVSKKEKSLEHLLKQVIYHFISQRVLTGYLMIC